MKLPDFSGVRDVVLEELCRTHHLLPVVELLKTFGVQFWCHLKDFVYYGLKKPFHVKVDNGLALLHLHGLSNH